MVVLTRVNIFIVGGGRVTKEEEKLLVSFLDEIKARIMQHDKDLDALAKEVIKLRSQVNPISKERLH